VRGVRFIAIVYAFTGYCAELLTLYHVPGWRMLQCLRTYRRGLVRARGSR
jgi:hypothetical protein